MNPFKSILMWVRFPELPIEYYDKSALFEIAKLLRKPFKVDYATDSISRGRYARVYIKIDITKALVPQIWVEDSWRRIEYENLHNLCLGCGMIGHLKNQCRATHPLTPSRKVS